MDRETRVGRSYLFYTAMFGMAVGLCFSSSLYAASFDCSKAMTNVEKMICEDDLLSKQDEILATTYTTALKKAPDIQTLKQQQRDWLRERNQCTQKDCVADQYALRIGELQRIESLILLDQGEESYYFESEAEKLKVIQDVVRRQDFSYSPPFSKEPEFCADFMRDFIAGENIEAIEPLLRSTDWKDPRFEMFNRCKEYPFPDGRSLGSFDGLGYTDKPQIFRYYQLELDGDSSNGKEHLLYEEPRQPGLSSYIWVDNNVCEVKGGAVVQTRQSSGREPRSLYRQNMLVNYRGHIMALILYSNATNPSFARYRFVADHIVRDKKPTGCAWNPKPAENHTSTINNAQAK